MSDTNAPPYKKTTISVIKSGGPHQAAPIQLWVEENEVGIRISLEDYLNHLVDNLGNPALIFTASALRNKLQIASDTIIQSMKAETGKIA